MLDARIRSQLFLVQASLSAISPYRTRTESKEGVEIVKIEPPKKGRGKLR